MIKKKHRFEHLAATGGYHCGTHTACNPSIRKIMGPLALNMKVLTLFKILFMVLTKSIILVGKYCNM